MNYFFIGGKNIGNSNLKLLINNYELPQFIVVYKNIIEKEVISNLIKKNIEIIFIDDIKKEIAKIKNKIFQYEIKVMISVAFPQIISRELLELVEFPINVHTSELPKYRGFHPINAAFLNDEKYQATTVHIMTEALDDGDIILQDKIEVLNEDNIVSVTTKLIDLSGKLLLKGLNQIETNSFYAKKQKGKIIIAPQKKPKDSKINFDNTSRYLHNFIRALEKPYPNAYCLRNKTEQIRVSKSITSNQAGVVLDKTKQGRYVISTSNGVILVETDKELSIGEILE